MHKLRDITVPNALHIIPPFGAVRCLLVEHAIVIGWHLEWVNRDGAQLAQSLRFEHEAEARSYAAMLGYRYQVPYAAKS